MSVGRAEPWCAVSSSELRGAQVHVLQSWCPCSPVFQILPWRSWSCLQLQLHQCYCTFLIIPTFNQNHLKSLILIFDVFFRSRSSEMHWQSIVRIGAAWDRPKGLKRRSLWHLQPTKNSTLVTHRGLYQLRKKQLQSPLQTLVSLLLIRRWRPMMERHWSPLGDEIWFSVSE